MAKKNTKKNYSYSERRSWKRGFFYGLFKRRKKRKNYPSKTKKHSVKSGAYNSRGKVNDGLVDDRHGPVVFFDPDFDFDSKGRIKGSYNANGFFEPD